MNLYSTQLLVILSLKSAIKLLCNNSIIFEPEWWWLKTVPFLKDLKRFSLVPAKGKRCCWFSTANTSPNCPSVLHQLKTPTFKSSPPPLTTQQWPITSSSTEAVGRLCRGNGLRYHRQVMTPLKHTEILSEGDPLPRAARSTKELPRPS